MKEEISINGVKHEKWVYMEPSEHPSTRYNDPEIVVVLFCPDLKNELVEGESYEVQAQRGIWRTNLKVKVTLIDHEEQSDKTRATGNRYWVICEILENKE